MARSTGESLDLEIESAIAHRALWSITVISIVLVATAIGAQTEGAQAHQGKDAHMTMKQDLATRAKDIHWPEGFDPEKADLFSHNALVINATCEKVWSHIVDAGTWPQWYPNSKHVQLLNGAKVLGPETVWRWNTFGLALESRVHEYVPYTRLGWYGYAPGSQPTFYHTWYLTPQGESCLVTTDEVGMGKDAAHLRETDESLMHRGHDLWLATLKWVSEGK
jgi:Polyketide cyclase / dehydrase and lipid transport